MLVNILLNCSDKQFYSINKKRITPKEVIRFLFIGFAEFYF